MKRLLKTIMGRGIEGVAKLLLVLPSQCREEHGLTEEEIFKAHGYALKTLWKNLPKLSSTTLDVSIVIPCYNAERYVKRLLESVLNQKTTCKYEVIAVDEEVQMGHGVY